MKIKRTLISVCVLCVVLLSALPATVQAQFTFTTNNGTITITGYTGTNNTVVIPSNTNGLPVTCIGNNAFFNGQGIYSRLTSVTIPNSVTNIGNSAFSGCYGLTNVIIGTNVASIGTNAFQYCRGLTNLAIPTSVTSIGNEAFEACTNLTAITVNTNNPAYSSVAGALFNKSQATLIQCPEGIVGSYTVPNIVSNIGNWAFEYCASLTDITISASVTSIGDEAFKYCTSLTEITVDSNNPTYSGVAGVLFDKNQATLIQYPEGIVGSYTVPGSVSDIGNEAFFNCILTNVIIGTNVMSIESAAFSNCAKLTGATIPNSITNIGDHVFYECTSLATSVTIGDNVIYIGDDAFGFCTDLTSATIGNGVSAIGNYEFQFCSSLTNIIIGNNITSIGNVAFDGCTSLTSVTIPNSVTNIGYEAFYFCTGLTNVTISDNVTSMGEGAFNACFALTTINIPKNITSIGYYMFQDCTSLASITIPNSVTNISYEAFNYCYSLTNIYFLGNAPIADSSVFYADGNVTAYYLSGTTGWEEFAELTGVSTTLWLPQMLTSDNGFGVQTNGFGFNINWASGQIVVVEACTNLSNPIWTPVATNTLTGGSSYFSDPQWTNYPGRFYRIRSMP